MTCTPFRGGFVCGPRQKKPPTKRCAVAGCRQPGMFECDWKMGTRLQLVLGGIQAALDLIEHGKTCDALVCAVHAREVGPDKHLCPAHQVTYEAWLETHPTSLVHRP